MNSNNPWNTDIYQNITAFAEGPQFLCAADQKCRYMMAGYWLGQILQKVQDKRDQKLNDAKMFAYASVRDSRQFIYKNLRI